MNRNNFTSSTSQAINGVSIQAIRGSFFQLICANSRRKVAEAHSPRCLRLFSLRINLDAYQRSRNSGQVQVGSTRINYSRVDETVVDGTAQVSSLRTRIYKYKNYSSANSCVPAKNRDLDQPSDINYI